MGEVAVDQLVVDEARAYLSKGGYLRIVVYTRSLLAVDKLRREYGGNYYIHGPGYTWVLSKKSAIRALMQQIKPLLPSKSGFEDLVQEYIVTPDEQDPLR